MKKDILKGNNLNITDLILGGYEDYDMEIAKAIDNNPKYIEAVQKIEGHYEKLKHFDKKLWLEMDSDINTLETIAKDTAFNEGFKLAIRLILSSVQ